MIDTKVLMNYLDSFVHRQNYIIYYVLYENLHNLLCILLNLLKTSRYENGN